MPVILNFEDKIINLIRGERYGWFTTGVNLGGVTGVSGGTGSPIGGFTGQLIQSKVTFDTSENEIWTVPISGESLVTNLDRIRYRIATVEASGGGGGGTGTGDVLVVQWDDAEVASGVIYLNFEGGVSVVDDGGSKVTVTVSGVSGDHDAIAIRGVSVVDWPPTVSGEVLIFDGSVWAPGTISGGGGSGATVLDELTDVVITPAIENSEVLAYNIATAKWINKTKAEADISEVGHVHNFLDLGDVDPSSFGGAGGYSVTVTQIEDALEFTLVSGGAGGAFLGLSDTPSDYTGYAGYSAVVNTGEDALEFINVSGGAGAGYTFGYEDVTSQVPDGSDNFTLAATPASGSLVVHYNGITQQPDNYSIITGGFHTLFSPVNGEELTAEYYTDVPQGSILGLTLEVQDTDVTETTNVAILNFEGMSVTDEGSGKVTVSGGIGGGGASTLDELTDVVITSVANNELLAYDTGGNWINQTPSEAGLPTAFLDLDDVDEISYGGFEGYSVVVNAGEDGLEFVNVSGGAGGGAADYSIWSPDAAPASASSYDDEFDDSSFDTGLWTEFDVATTQTPTEAEFGLHFVTSSTAHVQGAFQVAPASAGWSIMTKVAWLHPQADDMKAGLLLMSDYSNPSTSDCFYWASYRGGSGNGFQGEWYDDYANHNSTPKNDTSGYYPTTVYLRIRAEGTVWDLDWSIDGLSWIQLHTMTRSFVPDAFGICQRVSTSTDMKAVFPFFRYSTDVDCSDIMYGDRIDMWRTS